MEKLRMKQHMTYLGMLLVMLSLLQTPAQAQFFSKLSPRDELALGRQAAIEVERRYPVLRDGAAQRRVHNLGQRLARHSGRRIPYHFKVLNLPEVNAFALPGGYIYINRGVLQLARSENELAGVLAHEIAHVAKRHSVKQIQKAQTLGLGLGILDMVLGGRGTTASLANLGAQMVGQGVFLKHSRDAEREADREGVFMMRRAGMDPRGMLTFLRRLTQLQRSDPNKVAVFFSSHPSLKERERNVGGLIGTRVASRPPQRARARAVNMRSMGQAK